MAPLDRFTHVPTPPQDGSEPTDSTVPVLTHLGIGKGALWPDSSCSTADLRGCESEMPGDD